MLNANLIELKVHFSGRSLYLIEFRWPVRGAEERRASHLCWTKPHAGDVSPYRLYVVSRVRHQPL